MLKKLLLLVAIATLLPAAAFADSAFFLNSGGTLVGSPLGVGLVNSTLIEADINSGTASGTDLGTVNFLTGILTSGVSSLQNVLNNQIGSAVFAGGGAFIVNSNGSDSTLPTGTIFSGSFVGPVTFSFSSDLQLYTLMGSIVGTDFTGGTSTGSTEQFITNLKFKRSLFGTSGFDNLLGETQTVSAPEPGALVMMGFSALGIAGAMKRKYFA